MPDVKSSGSCLGPSRTPGPSLQGPSPGPSLQGSRLGPELQGFSKVSGPQLHCVVVSSGHAADLRTPRFVGSSGLAAGLLTACISVAGHLTACTSDAGLLTACIFVPGLLDLAQWELVTSPCGLFF
ncbi:hypothetical protein AMECASPLE_025287 [Ameca splendens]|uniref:Uncharacterized protein n=1 Tax=Ameca splendens TaxID=208324 RepID=A0ABV0XHK8_9TELE